MYARMLQHICMYGFIPVCMHEFVYLGILVVTFGSYLLRVTCSVSNYLPCVGLNFQKRHFSQCWVFSFSLLFHPLLSNPESSVFLSFYFPPFMIAFSRASHLNVSPRLSVPYSMATADLAPHTVLVLY